MLYLIIIFLLIVSFYTLTFAKYTWDQGNRQGAVSIIILALVTLIFPAAAAIIKL